MLLGCVIGTVGVADEATAKKPDLVEDALPARIELTFGGPTPAEAVQVLLRDFKVQSSGGFTTEHGALTLQPLPEQAFVLLRPIHAGPVAHWRADYEFPALDEGKSSTSRLGMVLGSRQQLVLALRRERTQGQNTGNLDVLLIAADDTTQTVRSIAVRADQLDGSWELACHHGYVRVMHADKVVLQAATEVNPNTAPVVGVWIEQAGGEAHVRGLWLRGAEPPPNPTEEQLAATREAVQATQRSAQAFARGELDEASLVAQEAVVLWKKAKGDSSSDAANAAFNLASIMKAKKDVAATIKAYEMVLDIRRQALGEKHPLVAQVQLELARAWAEQQDVEKSRALANAALAVLEASRGAEDVSTQEALRLAK